MTHPAQALAERCAELMWSNDAASKGLGMSIKRVEPGYTEMTMVVRSDMVNGQGLCHGGFIFSLADSAFAFASNTDNERAISAAANINFLAPASIGDELVAIARKCIQKRLKGIYDVEVSNQFGHQIALFRGEARRLGKQYFNDWSGEEVS